MIRIAREHQVAAFGQQIQTQILHACIGIYLILSVDASLSVADLGNAMWLSDAEIPIIGAIEYNSGASMYLRAGRNRYVQNDFAVNIVCRCEQDEWWVQLLRVVAQVDQIGLEHIDTFRRNSCHGASVVHAQQNVAAVTIEHRADSFKQGGRQLGTGFLELQPHILPAIQQKTQACIEWVRKRAFLRRECPVCHRLAQTET
jgi:hypothetical protein